MKTTSTRQRKTPQQRATEALEVAERKVARLVADVDRLGRALRDAQAALDAERVRRDYLAENPDLPTTEPTA